MAHATEEARPAGATVLEAYDAAVRTAFEQTLAEAGAHGWPAELTDVLVGLLALSQRTAHLAMAQAAAEVQPESAEAPNKAPNKSLELLA